MAIDNRPADPRAALAEATATPPYRPAGKPWPSRSRRSRRGSCGLPATAAARTVWSARVTQQRGGDRALRDILKRMRHDGCGGLPGRAELLTGIEGASSRPVRKNGLMGGSAPSTRAAPFPCSWPASHKPRSRAGNVIASARPTRRGGRPWHVWREPGDLGFGQRGITRGPASGRRGVVADQCLRRITGAPRDMPPRYLIRDRDTFYGAVHVAVLRGLRKVAAAV
jgi:hypothetical protein